MRIHKHIGDVYGEEYGNSLIFLHSDIPWDVISCSVSSLLSSDDYKFLFFKQSIEHVMNQ